MIMPRMYCAVIGICVIMDVNDDAVKRVEGDRICIMYEYLRA